MEPPHFLLELGHYRALKEVDKGTSRDSQRTTRAGLLTLRAGWDHGHSVARKRSTRPDHKVVDLNVINITYNLDGGPFLSLATKSSVLSQLSGTGVQLSH